MGCMVMGMGDGYSIGSGKVKLIKYIFLLISISSFVNNYDGLFYSTDVIHIFISLDILNLPFHVTNVLRNINNNTKVPYSCNNFTVQCTLYSSQFTVYTIRCTLYNVQCTVYRVTKY